MKNLVPNQEYGFRLRAANAAGQSEWGPVVIYRTSPAPPGRPEAVEVFSQVGCRAAEAVLPAWGQRHSLTVAVPLPTTPSWPCRRRTS